MRPPASDCSLYFGPASFNYGTANTTFAGDVTIGISNGNGINLISALMAEPNFSMNYLRSTTFTPNGQGSYTETLSSGSTPLSVFGTISGSAILGQGTGEVINAVGALGINAGGLINAPSRLTAQSLQFQSRGGAQFTGQNIFSSIGPSSNSGSASSVVIYNSPAGSPFPTLALSDLSNDAGDIAVNNTGGIELTGQVRATGVVSLTAQTGAITQTVSNSSTGLFAPSVITSSDSGTTLNYSGNQVGRFTANNATSGNVELVTTGPLVVGSISNPQGQVLITGSTGNLTLGAIDAASITLSAPNGDISQNAEFSTPGLLTTSSMGSTALDQSNNHIGSFTATATGAGNVSLTNVGVIDIQGISAANGNITVHNTGPHSTSGAITAPHGNVDLGANSPLTIGSSGVSASGDILLTATNLTSAGDLSLNGPITSSGGSIMMNAANNFTQNSAVKAARGVTANAGASLSFGPLATTEGNPVLYKVNGTTVAPPPTVTPAPAPTEPVVTVAEAPASTSPAISSSPTDLVVAFLSNFDKILSNQDSDPLDPDKTNKKTKNGVVTEGQTCSR